MLNVLFNDSYSQLTLMNNLNNETIYIIDDDFQVYGSISYNPWEPSDEDLLDLWKKAATRYWNIDKDDKLKAYRNNMFQSSLNSFKKWLDEQPKGE